jgi:hypothetical protein
LVTGARRAVGVGRAGREPRRGREGVVGVVELVVDELAADLELIGPISDGLAREGVEGELLANRRGQQPCGGG